MHRVKLRNFLHLSIVMVILALTACAGGPTGPGAAPGQPAAPAAAPGGELPVPRNETIYLEDTGTFRIFDSYNTYIPNGNDFANGYVQVGTEYLFYANFATGEIQPWLAKDYVYK